MECPRYCLSIYSARHDQCLVIGRRHKHDIGQVRISAAVISDGSGPRTWPWNLRILSVLSSRRRYSSNVSRRQSFPLNSAFPTHTMAKLLPMPPRTLPLIVPSTLAPFATSLILHPLLSAARKSPTLNLPILCHIPLPPPTAFPALEACVGFSILAFLAAVYAVPALGEAFMEKGLKGRDLLKGSKGQYMCVSS